VKHTRLALVTGVIVSRLRLTMSEWRALEPNTVWRWRKGQTSYHSRTHHHVRPADSKDTGVLPCTLSRLRTLLLS